MDKRYQVFVSSTYDDLVDERKEATQAILKCNCFPAGMELFPASNRKQWSVIKQVIDDSDFYLLIIAGRYGSLGSDDSGKKVGFTEMEFDYALSQGKPIIVMLHRHPENIPTKLGEKTEANIRRLEKFREKAMSGRLVAFWENKDQLKSEILNSLREMLVSTPEAIGWIKADTISNESNAENLDSSIIIERFNSIDNVEDKLNYLIKQKYEELRGCFEDIEFIKKFSVLININQPTDIICSAIDLIPSNLDYYIRKLWINMLDLKSLFFEQCKDGKIQDTELSSSIIHLLDCLGKYSSNYLEPVLDYIKAGNFSPNQKNVCMRYLVNGRHRFNKTEIKNLIEYIVHEIDNTHRALSINDLSSLLAIACVNEEIFVDVYNIFINNNKSVQRKIIDSIFKYCGEDMFIFTPRIQRMFFDIHEKVLLWDDDKIKAEWLLYCLYIRTYDIFTVDEVFSKVLECNDDVFYMFFWKIESWEWENDMETNYYNLDDKERHRIIQIIEDRNHPRGKKLLQNLRR